MLKELNVYNADLLSRTETLAMMNADHLNAAFKEIVEHNKNPRVRTLTVLPITV